MIGGLFSPTLFNGFLLLNESRKKMDAVRIFISKAVLLLCKFPMNRDADHLQCFTYDGMFGQGLHESEVRKFISELIPSLMNSLI
jgi:hypothetical protein